MPFLTAFSFLLTSVPVFSIVSLEQKKRKNSPHHSSFFLPYACRICFVVRNHCPVMMQMDSRQYKTSTIMIRKKSLFCKLIRIKNSTKSLFVSYMAGYSPQLDACPCCGARGSLRIHAYYGRSVIDFIGGEPVRQELTVLRLACSCGHTHAVLPDVLVPYSSYSLFFILRVLAESFARLSSIEKICERFSITVNQFYKWLGLWKKQKEEWLGVLSSMEVSHAAFMKGLLSMPCYSDFASGFAAQSAVSFLQSHKNPAHCRRQAHASGPVFR